MNMIYGFGGMRSDGDVLSFKPSIPKKWQKYAFTITVRGSVLNVEISANKAIFKIIEGGNINIEIFDKKYEITKEGVEIEY